MRSLWQNDLFWSQPFFLSAGYQPQVLTELAEGDCLRERAEDAEDAVYQVHPHDGEDGVSFALQFLSKITAQAVIFV
jgi:hypothetical protein